MRIGTKEIALVAIFASVYAAGSSLPGFPMIGVPDSSIDIVRSLETGYGLILGPVLGPLTAFLGAIVGKILKGGGIGLFFTPLAPVSALMAAALGRYVISGDFGIDVKKGRPYNHAFWVAFKVEGWIMAAAILIVLLAGWYGTGTGRAAPYYPVLQFTGLVIILGFRGRLADYLQGGDKGKLSLGVLLCSFPATMAGHMLGNLIFIYLFKPTPLFFMSILPVSALERVVITILSTMIATPLILIVRSLFPELVEKA